jgi:hypothetical protein
MGINPDFASLSQPLGRFPEGQLAGPAWGRA